MKVQETTKLDERTGETIYSAKVPEELVSGIEKQMNTHSQHLNQFVALSQQYIAIFKKINELFELKESAAKRVNEAMQQTIKKMKLDRNERWLYNLADKAMERREPPEIKPLEKE